MSDRNSPKPFTPTLSAAFTRSNKPPLTPKLAKPPSFTSSKRFTPSDTRSSSPPKDDLGLLSANVTPRSGPRSSRRDAPASSPANTPSSTHPSPQSLHSQSFHSHSSATFGPNYGYRRDRSPQGIGALDPRIARAKTFASENIPRPHSHAHEASTPPRFFHASDAKTSPVESDTRPKQGKLASSFFYANDPQEKAEEGTSPPVNGMKRRSTGVSRPITVAKSSSMTVPRLKSPSHTDSAGPWPDELRSQTVPPSVPLDGGPLHHPLLPSKRPEQSSPVPISHMKSASVDSANCTPPREGLRPSPLIVSPPGSQVEPAPDSALSLPRRPRVFSNESTNDSTASSDVHGPASPPKSEVASPTKSDPAANARIQRKILDLEISNSSLLAINRTLEREMRKQNAELRRYRRLSRSGRFSTALSNRSVSGGGLSATSEMEELGEMSVHLPDDPSDSEESVDESALTPDSLLEHDARHQARDEKRFYLDLAKHQELLVGSQKMDQSIRRCVGWTEELINEGRKALEYSVHVSDVELGGRVLAPEELPDIGESARGLLSPTHEISPLSPSGLDRSDEAAGSA